MDNLEKYIQDNRAAFDAELPNLKIWSGIESSMLPKQDALESYVANNREAFDTELPSLKIWAAIDKQINRDEQRLRLLGLWGRRVAAAVALLVLGATAGVYLNEKREDRMVDNAVETIAPDLKEAEQFYNQKVQAQLTKLVSYNPDPSVLADLQQLDEVQQELKLELERAPTSTKGEIVRRLIQNYQIKLGILERVLNHIDNQKQENSEDNQKNQKNESL